MVATHDLQIARLEQKYPEYVRNFISTYRYKTAKCCSIIKLNPVNVKPSMPHSC